MLWLSAVGSVPKVCAFDSVCSSRVNAAELNEELPGERYNLNTQCEMAFGVNHYYDPDCYDNVSLNSCISCFNAVNEH